ncbi:hypothetical protein BKA62DRAFT_292241 [Auriculariales sp. MPI-PUGE-AT-0066]|nr:hypothetical protein BKA62DRAFT_292241 [Auriculariales sp. MPI-PUGE-AT-0066]
MPLSTTSNSPLSTPLPSDLSDVGSLSDSDWCDVASSSAHGDSDVHNDSNESDIDLDAALASPHYLFTEDTGVLGLHLEPPASVVQSPVLAASHLVEPSPDSSVLFNAPEPTASTVTDHPATYESGIVADDNAGHAPTAQPVHHFAFPDPLSSVEDIRPVDDLRTMSHLIDSTSTISSWDGTRRLAEGDVAVSVGTRHVDLHIIVLGLRPSPIRTQRIVNMFVDAVTEIQGIASVPTAGHAPPKPFGLREFAMTGAKSGEQRVYRILVSDDGLEEDVAPAEHTLALVFFSATKTLTNLTSIERLPKNTRFVPLLHSSIGAFTPSLLQHPRSASRSLSASDDGAGWSGTSSTESSILVNATSYDIVGRAQQQRIDNEWSTLNVDPAKVLDVWPDGMRIDQQVAVPLQLLDRRSVENGLRGGIFGEMKQIEVPMKQVEVPMEASPEPEVPAKEKLHSRLALTREHGWTAFAVLSMLLAVLGSHVFTNPSATTTVQLSNITETGAPLSASSTTLATFVPPSPPSATPVRKDTFPVSLRNLALSVIANAEEEAEKKYLPSPAEVNTQQGGSSTPVRNSGSSETPCEAATPAALMIDPPSFKSRLMPLLPAGGFLGSSPQPVASTSKKVDTGEDTEYDPIFAAMEGLLSSCSAEWRHLPPSCVLARWRTHCSAWRRATIAL